MYLSVPASATNDSVSKVVSYAISHGYQIAPDALVLLRQFSNTQASHEKRPSSSVPTNLEPIIALVIEEKVRMSIGKGISEESLGRSITAADLVSIQPELFEDLKVSQEEGKRNGEGNKAVESSRTAIPQGLENKNESREKHPDVVEHTPPEVHVEIVSDPSGKVQPVGIEGFSQLFKSRYEKLVRILRERPEARQLSKISQLDMEKGGRIAGLVYSKRPTKNGIELTLDDESGKLSLLALSDQAKKEANEVGLDQCVMVEVEGRGGRLLLKSLTQPDVPNRVTSPSKKTAYAVFLSDLHVGSNKFLDGAFNRFLDWLSGRGLQAEEDEEIIRRLRYVIVGGDIVDGVGIFPTQEYELTESNVYKQYEMVSKKLSMIPEYLKVFVIPGNHDSTRQALPQPMIPSKYASGLYNLKNVTMLGDPSVVKLDGVSILMYHGRSLDDVLATTPGLSYERPTAAMKMLLKARHLAPMFGSRTPIAPEVEDHLVIEQVPDIFHAGHVHTVGVENYRGTLIINSGTWQAQTTYQANLGIMPSPGLVPIVNLATFEVKMREFLTTYESPEKVSTSVEGA